MQRNLIMETIKPIEREILTGAGGINCENKEGGSFFGVLASFAKKIGKKVLIGQFNFSSMQRPSQISLPVTHVQVIGNEFAYIVKACKIMLDVQDPIDRLQHLTSGVIGNLSYNVIKSAGRGPVNPVLGETLVVG